MKKTIIMIFVLIITTLLSGGIIYYNIKNGNLVSSTTGVDNVDFSEYEEENITTNKTITSGGVYNITGSIEGAIAINANNADVKLVLENATITNTNGPAILVESADNVYIELVGDNYINSTNGEENAAVYSKSDLKILGDGSLTIVSNQDGIISKDDLEIENGNITITSGDDGIIGRDSVYIIDGVFNITSNGDGIKSTNEEKGSIVIENGKFTITSKMDGIQSVSTIDILGGTFDITTGSSSSVNSTSKNWLNNSSSDSIKAIKASSNITISGGTFNIDSEDDAIHSNADIIISGGNYSISSGDDGIHADKNLTINNGTIDITNSYEGIEGENITVNGGDIKVVAKDDGFNAAGGSDGSSMNRRGGNKTYSDTTHNLTINGGTIYVSSSGDGIDSNGNIYITGGLIYVDGPTDNGNGAMDYGDGNYAFEITGGTLIAVGSSGMSVSPTNNTTQTSVLINLTSSYTGTFTFGNISYTPTKTYQSILISSDKLSKGKSYDLKINNETVTSVTLSSIVTTNGTKSGMQGGMPNQGNEMRRR